MKKIAALHAFVEGLNLVDSGQINSEADDLLIKPAGRQEGSNLILSEKHYTAVIFIERYPHGLKGEDVLFDNLSAWLLTEDGGNTRPHNFRVTLDVLDDNVADIEFRIDFTEAVLLQADPGGNVPYKGVVYGYVE